MRVKCDQKFGTISFTLLLSSWCCKFKTAQMANNTDYKEQRNYNYQILFRLLSRLPLSYMDNMRLHSFIKRNPLDALLIGRELIHEDYHTRIKPWIIRAIENSPCLNN